MLIDFRYFRFVLLAGAAAFLSACQSISNMMNPFYESPKPVALLGDKNDHALRGDKDKLDSAREALDAMASYQATNSAQPYNPVIEPAVVRLMWIPDHINKNGDLVPAHYYYLKVLKDRWAVNDAFELEGQLGGPKGSGSNIPFVYDGDNK